MNKLLSLLMACMLLALPCFAFAEEAEAAELRIVSTVPAEDLVFTHPYRSQYYRSSTQFALVQSGGADAVLQLTLIVCSDYGFLEIESATVTLGEESFLFEDIDQPGQSIYARPSYMETCVIVFDETHEDFLTALAAACQTLEEGAAPCQVMLHGAVDVEVTLGTGFAEDFLSVYALYTDDDTASYSATFPPEEEQPADDDAQDDGVYYVVVDATNATVKDRAAIRYEPSISADLLQYAYTGETFRLRYVDGDWYAIDVNGYYGYIHKNVAHIQE